MRFILYIIFLFPFVLSAQERTMDSLKLALKNAKQDTTRCAIMEMIIKTEENEKKLIFDIENLLQYSLSQLKNAGAKSSDLKLFYLKKISSALTFKGAYAIRQEGDNLKALNLFNKCLKIQKGIDDRKGMAYTLLFIGSIYDNFGDVSKALDYNQLALNIAEKNNDKRDIATALNNIGIIYDYQGDVSSALDYYQRSLSINEQINDKSAIALSYNNIALIYDTQHNSQKAIYYLNLSIKIFEKLNDNYGMAYTYCNMAGIFKDEGDFEKALEYYKKGLALSENIKNKEEIAIILDRIAAVYFEQGKMREALNYANRSLDLSKNIGFPEEIFHAAGTLKKIHKKQSNHKAALEMFELEIQMRDSISNTETKKASIKKQFQYEYEKKAAADSVKHAEEQKVKNALLSAQKAQLKQEKTQRLALYGGLVLVIAFSVFVFNRFRVTQKQKVIIVQQKLQVDEAFVHLEEKNKEVMDSIHYAKRIQTALLTSEKYIERKLNALNS